MSVVNGTVSGVAAVGVAAAGGTAGARVWPVVRSVAMAGARRVGELTARQFWQSIAPGEPVAVQEPDVEQARMEVEPSDSESTSSDDSDSTDSDSDELPGEFANDEPANEGEWPQEDDMAEPEEEVEPPPYAADAAVPPAPSRGLNALFQQPAVLDRAALDARVNMPTSLEMPAQPDQAMVRADLKTIHSSTYDFSPAARRERERFLGICDSQVQRLELEIVAKKEKKALYVALRQFDGTVESLQRIERTQGVTNKRQRRS